MTFVILTQGLQSSSVVAIGEAEGTAEAIQPAESTSVLAQLAQLQTVRL